MKNEVRKVDFLTEEETQTYDLTKEEALKRLKEANISESEQMLNKWCRDQVIDAVRIAKGAPKNRGIRVSSASLKAFIQTKSGNTQELVDEINSLKFQLEQANDKVKMLQQELKTLKKQGVKVPVMRKVNLSNFTMKDEYEGEFKSESKPKARFKVMFDPTTNDIIELKKNTRSKQWEDAMDIEDVDDAFKAAVVAKRQEYLRKEQLIKTTIKAATKED